MQSAREGDLVFGIVSRNPGNPEVIIPEVLKGRVLNVWQISHQTADTSSYGINSDRPWDKNTNGNYRWPYALQPIRTWTFDDPPLFKELNGYTPSTHTQKAITTLQEADELLGQTLKSLISDRGREIEVLKPQSHVLTIKVDQLRQKHPFAANPYDVQPRLDATNYIYIATLGKGSKTLKIGHSQDAQKRIGDFNKYRLTTEKQWVIHTDQQIGTVHDAIDAEKFIGETFASFRTELNNNEVFLDLDPDIVLSSLAIFRKA